MNFSDNTVLSVRALNDFVKRIVEGNTYLASVNIRGEISNFTNHYKSGHFYFSIKDEEAQVRCVMFSSYTSKLTFVPKDGMKVTAHGRVSMFVRDGQFIFYVDKLNADGIGELYLKYEETKKKLTAEGLFDPSRKKLIPRYPKAIGVITSETGAAIQDIRNILSRRYPIAKMILYPSLVQGKGAEDDLCRGVEYFSKNTLVDTIIIGRGGGSIEDLWSFNSEKLARKIYECPVPVISAVGHETDFTICDFVSDLRAPTPSAAAELAVPDVRDLKRQLGNVVRKLENTLSLRISSYRLAVEKCSKNRVLQSPLNLVDDKRLYTERLRERLCVNMQRIIDNRMKKISNAEIELYGDIRYIYEKRRTDYVRLTAKLEALNPMSVISRGYSAVFDEDGVLVKSIDNVKIGDRLNLNVSDGVIVAEAVEKKENYND
ncbi:MAG: exodeoxyribonuclease VII large subunit [Clostridia bacterium]|nr:exodeoxyribonuclease VII large subunit [Clostridia bacterium]